METQTQERATSFGDLVYCDYKYINVDSLSGDRYVLIFIDWSTRYVHSFCTSKREQAHKLLIDYMTMINNVHQEQNTNDDTPLRNTKLKTLHVDQASEFMSNRFQSVCHNQQVKLYSSGSGHHQSNSIAERVIGTLKDMALAMMYTSS
jgi:transposase InsO family protein